MLPTLGHSAPQLSQCRAKMSQTTTGSVINGIEMADKEEQDDKPRERSDAERRARQCGRLANLMKTLHLISGRGRWDAKGLAAELECSQRTVHRMLSTLSMAGVPWYFDEQLRAYQVRPGFKFPLAENAVMGTRGVQGESVSNIQLQNSAKQLIEDGEAFAESLQGFLQELKSALSEEDC